MATLYRNLASAITASQDRYPIAKEDAGVHRST